MENSESSTNWDDIKTIFEESVPFNKFLNIKVIGLESGHPQLRLDMREQYVGNYIRGNLHGGVISCLLDIVGGIVAFVDVCHRREMYTRKLRSEQFAKMGTIDIRVDYLRPGYGQQFVASGFVLRTGNKVAVTRMELHNEEDTLVAVGTGAYVIA